MRQADERKDDQKYPYYVCAPKKGYTPPGHPAACSFWIREEHLVDGLGDFLADRVFGAYRRDLLDANLEAVTAAAQAERETRIAALQHAINDKEKQSKRLVRNLALVDEPDQEFIRDINEQRSQLRAEREDAEQQLAALEGELHQAHNPDLLDHLPVTAVDVADIPEDLARRLFEALRLEIHYDCDRRRVTCRITLTGVTVSAAARASHDAVVIPLRHNNITSELEEQEMKDRNDLPPATICAVHPTSINANLNLHVNGPTVSVQPVHAKIRRDGYTGNTNAAKTVARCGGAG